VRLETELKKLAGQDTSVSGMLKLLGNGANGPILMALGPRSLRTPGSWPNSGSSTAKGSRASPRR
jgi:hypothetical protein